MDYQGLIEEITRLVMLELNRIGDVQQSTLQNVDRCCLLIVPDPEMPDFSSVFEAVRTFSAKGARVSVLVSQGLEQAIKSSLSATGCTLAPDPGRSGYGRLMESATHVVVPFVSVTTLSKISALIGDEAVSGVSLHALMTGKPLILCTDYIHSLSFSDTKQSKKILSIIRANLAVVEEMGAVLTQAGRLGDIVFSPATTVQVTEGSVRNVITKEDVIFAYNQNVKVMNFPRKTIVTPLAKDTAESLGIVINLV